MIENISGSPQQMEYIIIGLIPNFHSVRQLNDESIHVIALV
jgi:hypothetical protein